MDTLKTRLRQLPSLAGPFIPMEMDDMPRTPQAAFECWLNDAIRQGVQEPHAMTLSTVDADGIPDARVLILKNVDHRGWHFAIKVASPKGRQLAANPQAALTFYWPALGRQIRLRGTATALPAAECAEDFATRPLGSRISAMASLQSEVLAAPGDLSRRLQKARIFLGNHPEHTEPGWRLFALMPTVVEFWQGTADRLHQRLRYANTEKEGNWQKQMLWP
ncbi:pyridoxal 5'-phosphate synthase [Comamonas odontotermitis]|uniref:pyridoxine/pyridoxamine 5'-phosphate oxidase n=1 Tax=Comamonas odontotermitis TaxID=379895 RepID=UPI0037500C87